MNARFPALNNEVRKSWLRKITTKIPNFISKFLRKLDFLDTSSPSKVKLRTPRAAIFGKFTGSTEFHGDTNRVTKINVVNRILLNTRVGAVVSISIEYLTPE